jgi:hypothetical protein
LDEWVFCTHKCGRGYAATPVHLCRRYSLFALFVLFVLFSELLLPSLVLLSVEALFSAAFGFLVSAGILVDDLARLSVT